MAHANIEAVSPCIYDAKLQHLNYCVAALLSIVACAFEDDILGSGY